MGPQFATTATPSDDFTRAYSVSDRPEREDILTPGTQAYNTHIRSAFFHPEKGYA